MFKFSSQGKFEKTTKFLETVSDMSHVIRMARIDSIAQQGVEALRNATKRDTGKTAESWSYEIEETNGRTIVHWTNDNVNKGVNIAVILQYGHATRNGGYVQGVDYINPALRPIFDKMTDNMWKAVISL